MTGPVPRRRWGQRVLIALVVAVTLGTITTVAVNAARLGSVTDDVQTTRAQSINVTNADREALLLLHLVTELGETSTKEQIDQQRGLMLRQMAVATASFPPDSPQVRELESVRIELLAFPWEKLSDRASRAETRLVAMDLVSRVERQINALRTGQEKYFYSSASGALDANERSQVGLSMLVAVVLGLGILGVSLVIRRSRSDLARAYDELKGEVSERRAAEEALRKSEGRFRSLVQRASDLTVVTDEAGVITYVSPAAESLLGYRSADLLNRSLLAHVTPDDHTDILRALASLLQEPGDVHTVELRLRTADGRGRLIESVCQNLLADTDVGGLVWNGRDVTDRRALEDRLSYQASHDPLTGLPNRTVLLDRLESALARPPAGPGVAIILLDLDGFKGVNDTLGHAAGDELLRSVAKRLLGCVRAGDTAARLGGDEFAVVATVDRVELAVVAGQRIVDVLHQPFTLAGREVRISASIGIAHHSGGPGAGEDLMRDADIAMYVAKNTGKGRVEVFEPDMRERESYRIALQQELARAVDLNEIEVHFQPIIDLKTFRPRSLEALVRWRRPDGSVVPAGVFVPIAEKSGAIIEIGHEVLRRACRAVQHWREQVPGCGHLAIAVNVSVQQLVSGRLVEQVVAALHETGLPSSTLILEITEGAESADAERGRAELDRLRELGVRVSVDDFGSGHSSLGFLMGIDADALKIDRSLLDFDTRRQGSMVTAIAELGRTLGLTVVAEGVETMEHLHRALEAQCDAAQGYHFAGPLPFDEVAAFLAGWPERRAVHDAAPAG